VAEPRWIERLVVDAVHLDQIREHGGLAGVRDEDALGAAHARPRHKWAYDPATEMTTLAAAYGFDLCRSHPCRDDNKRLAFLVMVTFLELNGPHGAAPEEDLVTVMVALAAGHLAESELADWLAEHGSGRRGRGAVERSALKLQVVDLPHPGIVVSPFGIGASFPLRTPSLAHLAASPRVRRLVMPAQSRTSRARSLSARGRSVSRSNVRSPITSSSMCHKWSAISCVLAPDANNRYTPPT